MGHKVHPKSFRLPVTHAWDATWFSKSSFSDLLEQDVRLRSFLEGKVKDALMDRIEIERTRQQLTVLIHAAKPGMIIGRAGAGIEDLKKQVMKLFFRGKKQVNFSLNVKEVSEPALSARIVGQQIALDIERRMPFRRTMKQAMERMVKAHAEGARISLGGRLNGAEIARTETLSQGKVPLHNLRADIDFARVRAETIYGTIGIKVWINRGEVFRQKQAAEEAASSS